MVRSHQASALAYRGLSPLSHFCRESDDYRTKAEEARAGGSGSVPTAARVLSGSSPPVHRQGSTYSQKPPLHSGTLTRCWFLYCTSREGGEWALQVQDVPLQSF